MKRLLTSYPVLLLIVLLAIVVRLYRITNEPLDWHAWRQADTASVTREYVKNGIDLLRPEYHDLSSIPSSIDNPEGYRMVEFPILNAVSAAVVLLLPGSSVAVVSRLVSVALSAGTVFALFFLVKSLSGKKLAYLSALVFATLPFSIFYGRSILPEPGVVFFTTFSLMSFSFWLQSRSWKWWFASAVALALAMLLKPFSAFLGLVYLALLWVNHGKSAWKLWPWLLAFGAVSFAPFVWWRSWIQQFPSGIPASDWLFNGNGIRFRPAWVRWLGYERMVKLILGFVGTLFVFTGLLQKTRNKVVYLAWWASVALYFTVIATGNVQHDYYQVFATPIISIGVAEGMLWIASNSRKVAESVLTRTRGKRRVHESLSALWGVVFTGGLYLSAVFLSWMQVRGYFNMNHTEYQKVGAIVAEKTPADAVVIAPAMGDTQFLYQTNRRGWPIGGDIDTKRRLGATHYVTTTYDDEARELEEKFMVLEKTQEYLLIDLTKEKQGS